MPITFKRTCACRSLQGSSFCRPAPAPHAKQPSQREASWPGAEPNGAFECFVVNGKKKDLPDTLPCSRGFNIQRMYQPGDTHLLLGPGSCLDGKHSDPVPIHTANHLQTGKADIFSFSWHQPKRALKGGMGWWENSTLILFVLFMDS